MSGVKFKGVVDRISEGKAVILVSGGGELLLPAAKLPQETAEGSVLTFTAAIDKHSETERLQRAENIKSSLKAGKHAD